MMMRVRSSSRCSTSVSRSSCLTGLIRAMGQPRLRLAVASGQDLRSWTTSPSSGAGSSSALGGALRRALDPRHVIVVVVVLAASPSS